ncbi:MAG: hypothetical protein WCD79_08590 [Chthoniobacteraceae bacterium]
MVQFFLDRLVVCGLAFMGGVLVFASVNALRGAMPFDEWLAAGLLCVAVVFAAAWTWLKRPTLERTAMCVDTACDTRDRFLTAYVFSRLETPAALETAAMRECADFIAAFDVRAYTRFRFPRLLPWLLVPVTALCLLALHANMAGKFSRESAGTNAVDGQRKKEFEKIAQTIDQAKSDDLKTIADEIRKSEKRMDASKPDETARTALREMSTLESMIQEMLKSQKSSPEEMAALAEALKQSELTKEAASALESGKPDEAAARLEKLLQQQKGNPELDKTGQAVQQALKQLAEDQKGGISKQMQQPTGSGSGDRKDAGAQALQRLAEALRKAAGNAQQQNSAEGSKSQETMRNILSELQAMKYGGQSDQAGSDSQQGNPGGPKMIMVPGSPQPAHGQSPPALTGAPSGTHGDHDDTGTTKDPLGAQQKQSDASAAPVQLNGVSGEGQSLHDFMTATGDHSQSSLQYQKLYNAMLPAAEEAIMQENIPLGSRFYIKRYFQSIRPKE